MTLHVSPAPKGCTGRFSPLLCTMLLFITLPYLFDILPGKKQTGFHEQEALHEREEGPLVHPVIALYKAETAPQRKGGGGGYLQLRLTGKYGFGLIWAFVWKCAA